MIGQTDVRTNEQMDSIDALRRLVALTINSTQTLVGSSLLLPQLRRMLFDRVGLSVILCILVQTVMYRIYINFLRKAVFAQLKLISCWSLSGLTFTVISA